MIAIEFKRVIRESIIIFLVLVGLLVGILISNIDVYLAPVFEIFLLLYASFTGWSMFDKERNEGAMEYLLSLPVSRVRLFFIKLMPRVVSVGLILVFYMLLHGRFEFPSLLPVTDFSIFYIAFFLVSLSLSLSLKSFIGAFFLTSLVSGGLTLLNYLVDIGKSDSSLYFQANAPLIVFPVLLFIMFHFYDVKPTLAFDLKFTGLGIGLLLLIVGINILAVGKMWCQYFLTDNGSIYRVSSGQSQLINNQQKIIKRYPGHLAPMLQNGNSLYIEKSKGHTLPESIDILNLETGKSELLYHIPKDWVVIPESPGKSGIFKEEKYYALMGNYNEKKYSILEISGKKVREIPITGNFKFAKTKSLFYHAYLVYALPDAQGFILNWNNTLYFIDESGNPEKLFKVDFLALWKNRLLVFDGTGIILFEISKTGELTSKFKKEWNIRKIRRRFGTFLSRKVLARDHEQGKYFIFNLENLSIEEVPLPFYPYYYLEKGNRFILVWASGDEISFGEFKDGKVVTKKEWKISVNSNYGPRIIRVYNTGVVIYNRKEFETYWFD